MRLTVMAAGDFGARANTALPEAGLSYSVSLRVICLSPSDWLCARSMSWPYLSPRVFLSDCDKAHRAIPFWVSANDKVGKRDSASPAAASARLSRRGMLDAEGDNPPVSALAFAVRLWSMGSLSIAVEASGGE